MLAGSPQTGWAGRLRAVRGMAALVAGLLLAGLTAAPGHAQAVCWYNTAQKLPEAAIAACDKVIDGKAWNRVVDGKVVENHAFRSALYLSRAMARFELATKARSFTVANMKPILSDLDQSVSAQPQEHAHTLRALLYERMARLFPSERARYRKLAVQEARAAMAFPGTAGDDLYQTIIRGNR